MSIVNINYNGHITNSIEHLDFRMNPPQMHKFKYDDCTLLVFKSKKCRIMGCKSIISKLHVPPFQVEIDSILSITAVMDLGYTVNPINLAKRVKCWFEPEIFPALRLTQFNPYCVNVFASGKVVICGGASLDISFICLQIFELCK